MSCDVLKSNLGMCLKLSLLPPSLAHFVEIIQVDLFIIIQIELQVISNVLLQILVLIKVLLYKVIAILLFSWISD